MGNGDDFELPPETSGGAAIPAVPQPSADLSPGDSHGSILYTCRLTFDIGDVSPATAMLRCQYVARGSVAAIRLNGKSVPRSGPVPAEVATCSQASGAFVIYGGLKPQFFVPGTNVLEIDVNNAAPSGSEHMLWLRPEVSGIRVVPVNGSLPGAAGTSDAVKDRRETEH